MDAHSAPVRSRSSHSQSTSPSHSHSASSSLHHHKKKKRKFTSPSPSASAFTPNSDQSPSASEPEEDLNSEDDTDLLLPPEDNESEDDVVTSNDEDEGDVMRNFTAARLARPVKVEGGVKAEGEAAGGGKEGGLVTGVNVKEDKESSGKGVFTENIQASGAYSAREEGLKREEEAGKLKFLCYSNDGIDQHMIWLIGLKNIFARQLPNMPKEYIVRLVMDRTHKSMMVIRHNHVVGGITYRPYKTQRFGEIAFCAITADEQVKGYGTRLMNHLKTHARDTDGLTHFLTYADNNAVGYFIKQGFTKEITLDKNRWHGYIKDYDGGILMECRINLKLPYTDLATMVRRQRQAIDEKIRELSNCHIVYDGIDFQKKDGIPRKLIKVDDIPGLKEAGWSSEQWPHTRFKTLGSSSPDALPFRQHITALMRALLKMMNEHPDAWPFKEPVDGREVPDYYDIIKDPMDLKTMMKRVESDQYYVTFEMFVADVSRMFANAKTYNAPETIYYKCATRLQNHFTNKVQAYMQSNNNSNNNNNNNSNNNKS